MPRAKAKLHDNKFARGIFLASLLIVVFATPLSQWLGLYGGVALVSAACFAVFWPLRVTSGRFDIANVLTMFVAYYFLMFGLYGFMNAFGLSHFLGVSYDPGEDSPANLSSLASVYAAGTLLAVYAGYLWSRPTAAGGHNLADPSEVRPLIDMKLLRRLQMSAWLALGVSYVGMGLLIFFLGGSSVIGRDPSEVATTGSHGLYWAQSLIWSNHWAVIVNFFSYSVSKKLKYLTLTALSFPVFLLEFLLSGSKSAILFPLLGFLIVRHYCLRRVKWRMLVALTLIAAAVFAAGYAYRATGAEASGFEEGVAGYYQNPLLLMQTMVGRFYGTDSFAIILDSVRGGHPLLMGASLSDLWTWYIPRWLWPGKPLSYSLTFGDEFMSGAEGAGDVYYSPSLPGELYLNFGVLGLPLGGFAVGLFLRLIFRSLVEPGPHKLGSLIIYSVIAPLTASLSGGPISAILEFIMTRVIVYLLFFWFAGMLLSRSNTGLHPSCSPA